MKTDREKVLADYLEKVLDAWKAEAEQGDGICESHFALYTAARWFVKPKYERDVSSLVNVADEAIGMAEEWVKGHCTTVEAKQYLAITSNFKKIVDQFRT